MIVAHVAMRIAAALSVDDIVFLADDDQQGEAIAAALTAIVPANPVVFLPSSDALPGDTAPASPANTGRRVAALRAIRAAQADKVRARLACISSGEAAAQRYPVPAAFDAAPPVLRIGGSIDPGAFGETLRGFGYIDDDRVDEPGEVAIRGEVIDIFPADAGLPARIEIVDDTIAAIRSYDATSQRSIADLDELEVGRASEPGTDGSTCLLDHFVPGRLLLSERADRRRGRFIALARDAAERQRHTIDAVEEAQWSRAAAAWNQAPIEDEAGAVPRFAETRGPMAAMGRFATPLIEAGRTFLLAGSARDLRFLRRRVATRLRGEMVGVADWAAVTALPAGSIAAIEMPVDAGFVDDALVVVAAADLLGSRVAMDGPLSQHPTHWIGGAAEIRIGDVVVHEDHGLGVVAGLEPSPSNYAEAGEMIVLDYARDARRLVPVDEADRLWRYGADRDAVTLDTLDGASWTKRRGEVAMAVAESAKALAALAAERAKVSAPVIDPDAAAYERFAAGFPFNETADQARAIAQVRADLASGKPMDRLIVGDVGYGKTEVALRAAALAALAGYQVIVAAPTTVLVRQHLDAFQRRFAGSAIGVAGLSRLSSAAEKKAVKAGLADGTLHVVVGTAAVMAKGVRYANLGLLVIDEEQRFGAADKAKLRGSGDTHLLSLSATPIPRTLQMALVGLQQISVIATPPARRQPIRTSIDQFDETRIRTALLREKGRGGQSFVVVPRIEDMGGMRERLNRAAPDLAVVEAHGKMAAGDIDAAMVDFAQGTGDVLLATNIIEAGLDVPRANTMIVWRADRFGLAQLHQLRGRVGRGNRRGQVILLTEREAKIGAATVKRLRTLATYDQLGAGFDISTRDLDMRGGGDLLGAAQAGHTKLIGIDLYQHLLGMALRQVQGEDVDRWTPEVNIGATGMIPTDWIPEPDTRLSLYVRLARLTTSTEIEALEVEMSDRFGNVPPAARALLDMARVRLMAYQARVRRVDAGPAAIAFTPRANFSGDADAAGLIEKNGRLLLDQKTDPQERAARVQIVLEALAE